MFTTRKKKKKMRTARKRGRRLHIGLGYGVVPGMRHKWALERTEGYKMSAVGRQRMYGGTGELISS